MYNHELLFKLGKARRDEILQEVEKHRQLRELEKHTNSSIDPRIAWALVGPALAVVLAILIF
jgi:hypothetical protein